MHADQPLLERPIIADGAADPGPVQHVGNDGQPADYLRVHPEDERRDARDVLEPSCGRDRSGKLFDITPDRNYPSKYLNCELTAVNNVQSKTFSTAVPTIIVIPGLTDCDRSGLRRRARPASCWRRFGSFGPRLPFHWSSGSSGTVHQWWCCPAELDHGRIGRGRLYRPLAQ